jgi:hypothetical protein
MEATVNPRYRAQALAPLLRLDRRAVGAWTLGFAPVLYLALRGGGYDTVVYSQVSLAVWWIVLLGVVVGVLPVARIGRLAWVCIGLLGAFALWTLIAAGWSSNDEQTIDQLGRVGSYLGWLVLGLCVLRRNTLRPLASGLGTAFGIVGLLAVLSRLYPAAFPHNQALTFFPGSENRLSYPLNYADGTAEFIAIGLPLLLTIATRARTLAAQALAASAVPVSALAIVLTASRGGVLAAIVTVAFFYLLSHDRLPKLATGLVAAAGSAILIAGLLHRSALRAGLSGSRAVSERHQLALIVVVVCVGVALVQVAIGLVARYARRPATLAITRRRAAQVLAGVVVAAVIVAVATGVPGQLAHQWRVFKDGGVTQVAPGNVFSRLGNVGGSNRYQYWTAAVHAFESKPLTGIGPGNFQFYWAQHGSVFEPIINAHSLYLETLAETGVVGLALLAALLAAVLGTGVWLVFRAPPLMRTWLAGATAAFAGFCAAAAWDWVWQLPAIPIAALLLGAGIVGCRESRPREANARWQRLGPRALLAVLAVASLIAVAVPFAATSAYRASQGAVEAGKYSVALSDAATAQRLEPYAATPRLQRALILEALHDYRAASIAVAAATARGSTNWELWLVRARIDAEAGHARAAVRDFRRAHALNPLSPATIE